MSWDSLFSHGRSRERLLCPLTLRGERGERFYRWPSDTHTMRGKSFWEGFPRLKYRSEHYKCHFTCLLLSEGGSEGKTTFSRTPSPLSPSQTRARAHPQTWHSQTHLKKGKKNNFLWAKKNFFLPPWKVVSFSARKGGFKAPGGGRGRCSWRFNVGFNPFADGQQKGRPARWLFKGKKIVNILKFQSLFNE